jgi:hypothetical protein
MHENPPLAMYGAQNHHISANMSTSPDEPSHYWLDVNYSDCGQNIHPGTSIPLSVFFPAQEASQWTEGTQECPSKSVSFSETFGCSSCISHDQLSPAYIAHIETQPQPMNRSELRFRPSKYQLRVEPSPMFYPKPFKNSHYNKAHYNNPDFQPEQWTPDSSEKQTQDLIRPGRKGQETLDAKSGTMISPCTHIGGPENVAVSYGEMEMGPSAEADTGVVPEGRFC